MNPSSSSQSQHNIPTNHQHWAAKQKQILNEHYNLLFIPNLSIRVVFEELSHKRVKGVPVVFNDVASNGPEVAENKDGAEERMELSRVKIQVHLTSGAQHKGMQQLAQSDHFADVNLMNQKI